MDSRSSWPAAAAAAALVALLPGKASAERPPTHLLEPPTHEVVFDDSDPWRPDVDQPGARLSEGLQTGVAADPAAAPRQPARHESWLEAILRMLRFFFLGGAAR
jgi:hypothetical protein